MPLSEDEQRILRDIEANFYENDPKFVRTVTRADQRLGRLRGVKIPAVMFFVGLIMVIGTYHSVWLVAALGFAVMVASAGIVVQNVGQRIQESRDRVGQGDSDENEDPGSQDFRGWPS